MKGLWLLLGAVGEPAGKATRVPPSGCARRGAERPENEKINTKKEYRQVRQGILNLRLCLSKRLSQRSPESWGKIPKTRVEVRKK